MLPKVSVSSFGLSAASNDSSKTVPHEMKCSFLSLHLALSTTAGGYDHVKSSVLNDSLSIFFFRALVLVLLRE